MTKNILLMTPMYNDPAKVMGKISEESVNWNNPSIFYPFTKTVLQYEFMKHYVDSEKKKLLVDSSIKSLENAYDLFEESAMLYEHKHYPRGFALGVLSAEEMAKSFIYRCVALELLQESDINKLIKIHDEKITKSAHLMVVAVLFHDYSDDLMKSVNHDKSKHNHSDHIFPDVIEKSGMASAEKVVDVIKNAHSKKLDALYVHLRANKIIEPKDIIDKAQCDAFFTILGKVLSMMKYMIDSDDNFTTYAASFFKSTIDEMKSENEVIK